MKKRVAVAMSGGVDSAVAAALLKEKGCEVIGLTMCFGLSSKERRKPGCCSLSSIDDARRVAHKLGIKHLSLICAGSWRNTLSGISLPSTCAEKLPTPALSATSILNSASL